MSESPIGLGHSDATPDTWAGHSGTGYAREGKETLSAEPTTAKPPGLVADVIPTLPAVHVRGRTVGQLVAWCPHCRTGHWHGGGDIFGDGDGHRQAHCSNRGSPLLESGYHLREVATTSPDVRELLAYLKRERIAPVDRHPSPGIAAGDPLDGPDWWQS